MSSSQLESAPTRAEQANVFLARQPILDRRSRLAAYELLYRDRSQAGGAVVQDPSRATARVAMDTVMTMGMGAVLNDRPGFLNVDLELLAAEAIEALPAERIVLEILETVPAWAHERCRELQGLGFQLALDDYVPGDPRAALVEAADYVKVDLVLTPPDALPALVDELRPSGARLVAEKVETREDFQRCLDLGFDLFQGYYFAKPTTLGARSADAGRSALLRAFSSLSDESSLDDVERCFMADSRLGLHLLRLANSAGLGARQKITTLRHAIMYVGRAQLRRWVLLMLYAGGEADAGALPLAELAAVRGRLLELLIDSADEALCPSPVSKECAFLVGMLSLSDVLLCRPLDEVLDELHVEGTIREAVVERRGALGLLLESVECLERGAFTGLAERLREASIATEKLVEAQNEAYRWLAGLHDVLGPTP